MPASENRVGRSTPKETAPGAAWKPRGHHGGHKVERSGSDTRNNRGRADADLARVPRTQVTNIAAPGVGFPPAPSHKGWPPRKAEKQKEAGTRPSIRQAQFHPEKNNKKSKKNPDRAESTHVPPGSSWTLKTTFLRSSVTLKCRRRTVSRYVPGRTPPWVTWSSQD